MENKQGANSGPNFYVEIVCNFCSNNISKTLDLVSKYRGTTGNRPAKTPKTSTTDKLLL